MSLPHHGSPEESRLLKRFQEQQQGTVKREWPEGRIEGKDDGEIAFKISSEPNTAVVKLDFGKPVTWVGMSPTDAVELAQLLIKHARSVSKEPIRVVLN